jgi:hypothetical protein
MNKILPKIIAWFFVITGHLILIAALGYVFYMLWPISGIALIVLIFTVGFVTSCNYLFGNKDDSDDKYDDIGW